MKKNYLSILCMLCFPMFSWAQLQLYAPLAASKTGAIEATAYNWEAIGINPANLGWNNNQTVSFTIADLGFSGQSAGISYASVYNSLFAPSQDSKANNWEEILGANNGLLAYADVNWLAFSFRIPKLGCVGISLRDKVYGTGFVGPDGSQVFTNGNNYILDYSDLMTNMQGSYIHYSHYRELNIDYGMKILSFGGGDDGAANTYSFDADDKTINGLYVGAGYSFLGGLADINGVVTNNGMTATYTLENNYPQTFPIFPNNGKGSSVEFGASASYNRWKFGMSVTNLGSITWTNVQKSTVYTPSGIVGNITDIGGFIGSMQDGSMAGKTEPAPDYTTTLPEKLRLGASYKLNSHFLFSSDFVMRLNNVPGNLIGPYYAIGAQISTLKFLTVCTGLATTEGYGISMPLGLDCAFFKHHWEVYLGTVDLFGSLQLFNDDNLSAVFGMLKFNF
ncbi:MAG TPA: DUF5723 family protein [Bacteroidia bacterium]|nr:DUF5723 family protein [Bacteroidia bacterium]